MTYLSDTTKTSSSPRRRMQSCWVKGSASPQENLVAQHSLLSIPLCLALSQAPLHGKRTLWVPAAFLMLHTVHCCARQFRTAATSVQVWRTTLAATYTRRAPRRVQLTSLQRTPTTSYPSCKFAQKPPWASCSPLKIITAHQRPSILLQVHHP